MQRHVEDLTRTHFDLVVIGGGINGAATAREAALRGLTVALVEGHDFASATSSRSSKLIHGGLRYLERLDFKLVGEARRERTLLLKLAPHLVRQLPFFLPIYSGDPYNPTKVRLGLTIYDWLGNQGPGDRHRFYTAEQCLEQVPVLRAEGLRAGAVYFDSETDDARLSLENVLDATANGAAAANYVQIESFDVVKPDGRGPQIRTAQGFDRISGRRLQITGDFWVNATGPWVDSIRAMLPGYDGSKTVRLTKGTHVLIPQVCGQYALFAAILPGNRIFVMAPWHGYSLLGTTDDDYVGDPAGVQPSLEEMQYLLNAINRVLSKPFTMKDVVGSFAGLRALAIQAGRSPSENTREYRFHTDAWAENLITVCGGKLTTARALGEKLVDVVVKRTGKRTSPGVGRHPSRQKPLPGGRIDQWSAFFAQSTAEAVREFGIAPDIAGRIINTYGSRWRRVLEPVREEPWLAERLPGEPALLAAEADFALREEMATSVEDFLLRRSGLNWMSCRLRDAAPAVAGVFARRLDWNSEMREASIRGFEKALGVPAVQPAAGHTVGH